MVNAQLLEDKITESGLKIGYIVDTIGISRQSFDLKKKNERKFRVSEVYVLCDLLNIDDCEKKDIFFACEVE